MLNFRGPHTGRRAPNYLAGPGRRKLIYAVALIGLVALLIKKGLEPWPARQAYHGPSDTLLPKVEANEPLDGAFVVAKDEEKKELTRKLFPGVREDFLDQVRDDNFFRPRESNAFFHLLRILNDSDVAAINRASRGPVTFAQLYDQPAAYRGEIVTLRGRLRQLQRVVAVQNEYDVDDYYQATIQPDDNPTFPVLAYIRQLPAGFPSKLTANGAQGGVEFYNDDVLLTGFFFKRLAYKAKDDIRTAPLMLTQSFQWRPSSPAGQLEKSATWTFRSLAVGITVGMLLLVLVATRTRGSMARWSQLMRNAPQEDLRQLSSTDFGLSTTEQLRQLERESQPAPPIGPPRDG